MCFNDTSGTNRLTTVSTLIGAFGLYYIIFGTAQSFGVIYSELLDQFQSGKAETSWIPSLSTGLLLGLGPIAGFLEQKFGCRTMAIFGSITMATGMLCSGFVDSLYLLYLTYGIINGIGFGLTTMIAHVVVPYHFRNQISLAVACASTGGGVGTITTPLLTRMWLTEFGWRGTFILQAGVALQGAVFGALLFDKKKHIKVSKDVPSEGQQMLPNIAERIKVILQNKKLAIFNVSSFFILFAYFSIYVILPNAAETKGLTKDEAAILITSSGISGLIGRILLGIIADRPEVNRCVLNGGFLFMGGLATVGCSYIYSYSLFLTYALFLGIFLGVFGFLQGVITNDLVGRHNLSLAYGFIAFFQGISVTLGPPITGWIVDATGRYDEAFYFLGAVFMVGGLLSALIPLYDRFTKTDSSFVQKITITIVSESTYL